MLKSTSEKTYVTVNQLSEKFPAFSRSALRNLIYRSEPTHSSKGIIPSNGLESAIVRIGRKVLIDEQEFFNWIERHKIKNSDS
jgi:hypothetical protein